MTLQALGLRVAIWWFIAHNARPLMYICGPALRGLGKKSGLLVLRHLYKEGVTQGF